MASLCEKWKWRHPFIQRSRPSCPQWKLWPGPTCLFWRQNKFWSKSPTLRNRVLFVRVCVWGGLREAKVTGLITSCHCVPGCPSISVSQPCVKHDGDNSRSQTFSRRKNKSDIFSATKANSISLYLQTDCIGETTTIQRREILMFVIVMPPGTKWHLAT